MQNYVFAQIQIDSDLASVDDESLDTMRRKRLAKGQKPPHLERIRIRNRSLLAYAPLDRRYELSLDEAVYMAEVIPGMSREAAKGILEAFQQGYFDTPGGRKAWTKSFSRLWTRIVATDKKNATAEEKRRYLLDLQD